MSMFSGFKLQDEHMHALLHGQAVSSSSMERYGDKDSDSGDVTPKYTGEHIIMQEDSSLLCGKMVRCCNGQVVRRAPREHSQLRSRLTSASSGSAKLPHIVGCWCQLHLVSVVRPRRCPD